MRRNKKFVVLIVALLSAILNSSAEAQQAAKLHLIGYLSASSVEADKGRFAYFQRGLQELGYTQGKNVTIEQRYVGAQAQNIAEQLAELIRVKVDVLVVYGESVILAAKKGTATVPIVMTVHPDPVGDGIVASIARPGGNITGLSDLHTVLAPKRLEILKEVVPAASRIAVLYHAETPTLLRQLKDIQDVAPTFRVTVVPAPVASAEDLDPAFSMIKKERVGALIVLGSPLIGVNRRHIVDLAAKSRLPAIYTLRENAEAGGLMAYGANFDELWHRAATYVDKILKGAKPADLPIEQPTKFELVINLKTAKQIGLTIPPNVLARADRVIR